MSQSYTITLWCGCQVYVACHPRTRLAHARIIETRGRCCRVRRHEIGARVWLWEMLPDPRRPHATIQNESERNIAG